MPDRNKLLNDLVHNDEYDFDFHEENKILAPLLEEINLIHSQSVQYFTRAVLLRTSEFWYAPADTEPGHPEDEYEEGGLVKHTQRAVRTGVMLCDAYGIETDEKDLVISAILIHDITKAIKESDEIFFDPMHPYTVDAFVKAVRAEDKLFSDESKSSLMYIKDEIVNAILRLVRCHLGLYSPIPETIPITTMDMIVHLADLVSCNLEYLLLGPGEEEDEDNEERE